MKTLDPQATDPPTDKETQMTAALIEVRIRTSEEAEPVHLCTWPSTQLDSLIPTVKRWGVYVSGTDVATPDTPDIVGQFVVGDSGYFELVVEVGNG
jgi:hypothetical protein